MLNKYSILPLIAAFLFLSQGIFVYFNGKGNRSIRLGFLLNSCATFWWQFSWVFLFNTSNIFIGRIIACVGHIGIAFIPATFLHYFYAYIDSKTYWKHTKWFYLTAAFFVLLIPTRLFVDGVNTFYWGFYPKAGLLHPLFLLYLFISMGACVFHLVKRGMLVRWQGMEGAQLSFLLASFLVYCLASADFLVNYGFPHYPMGVIAVLLSLAISAYAIVRHRLMDIRLALSNTVIFIGVYALVLGLPFYIYCNVSHLMALVSSIVLALSGPVIFNYLQRQAEGKILEQQKRYQAVLQTTSKNINQYKTADQIIHQVCVILFKSIGLKSVAFYLRVGDRLVIKRTQTNDESYPDEINNKELIEDLINLSQPVLLKEMQHNNYKVKQVLIDSFDSLSEMAVPLVQSGRLVGLILMGEKKDGSIFSKLDFDTFDQISDNVALAIENAVHMEDAKKRNEEENKDRRQFQLDRFASSMGHQIRNPLNVISQDVLGIEIIMKKYKSVIKEDHYRVLEENKNEIKATCSGISTTIKTILDYGRGSIELKKIKVSEILDQFNILNQIIIEKYHVPPKVELEKDLPDVFGDINMINEVLIVYFENSCQAVEKNEKEKTIDFKVYRPNNNCIRFEIADNGHGIGEETQKAIFDVSTSTKGTEGNGLGLFRVRKVCSLMKGSQYGFYSAGRGFGAKFWIDIAIQAN